MTEYVQIHGAEPMPPGAVTPPFPNGAAGVGASPPGPAGPLPVVRRTAWLPADDYRNPEMAMFRDAYPGYKVRIWVNHPKALRDQLTAAGPDDETADQAEARRRAPLKRIVLEHNGWPATDPETGEASGVLPQPTEDAFWLAVPDELAGAVVMLVYRSAQLLPNSMVASLGGSRRG